MLASFEVAQMQRANPHALQPVDCTADRDQHAPHFALATLDQHDSHQSPSWGWTQHLGAHDARWPIVQDDAAPKLLEVPLAEIGARHLDVILLFDAEPRVCEAELQLA